jgi:hypothetical protein
MRQKNWQKSEGRRTMAGEWEAWFQNPKTILLPPFSCHLLWGGVSRGVLSPSEWLSLLHWMALRLIWLSKFSRCYMRNKTEELAEE